MLDELDIFERRDALLKQRDSLAIQSHDAAPDLSLRETIKTNRYRFIVLEDEDDGERAVSRHSNPIAPPADVGGWPSAKVSKSNSGRNGHYPMNFLTLAAGAAAGPGQLRRRASRSVFSMTCLSHCSLA